MRTPFKKKNIFSEGTKMGPLVDSSYAVQTERNRLRKLRLLQVRKMSNEAAKMIRKRVKDEQERKLFQIANEELQRYICDKTRELAKLEREYQSALAEIGQGYQGLQEEENYHNWLKEQKILRDQIADIRGDHALKVINYQKVLDSKLRENKAALKDSVKASERLRAAEIRNKPQAKRFNKVEIVEINPNTKDVRKVKFIDRNLVVDSNVHGMVERLRETVDIGQGLELAIEELENILSKPASPVKFNEKRRFQEKNLERHSFTHENEAKLSKPDSEAPLISKTRLDSSEDSFADVRKRFEALLNRDRNFQHEKLPNTIPKQGAMYPDTDLTPVRGPSSADASGVSTSSSTPSSLHATVTRPIAKKSELPDKNIFVGQPSHNTKTDEGFIRKVLQGVEMDSGLVDVKVQVKECSTLSSSHELQSSSEASIDQSKEKFLVQNWGKDLTDYAPIHGLIEKLKTSSKEKTQQDLLRYYIEKLLKMKRQEIAELSLTSNDYSMGPSSNEESAKESSLRSSLTLSSDKSMTGSSNLTSDHDPFKGFISSTPASTLSSSESKSSGSKTVRFKLDDQEGTFLAKREGNVESKEEEIYNRTRESLNEIMRQYKEEREVIEKEIAKRRLKKKKEKYDVPSTSSSESIKSSDSSNKILSEGPLSSSSSVYEKSQSFSKVAHEEPGNENSLSASNQVHKTSHESVSKVHSEREAKILTQKKIRKQQLEAFAKPESKTGDPQLILVNKSSSSGTSGSTATAEFLARLRGMELPLLRRPTPDQISAMQQSSGQNTSSDVAKLQDLESSSAQS